VWRDRGVKNVNEPFAIMIHSRCPWSADLRLDVDERDLGAAAVYGCVEPDESVMYELWSDWVFRVAQTDLLSHFNGDHFDMPYILCRLTGNPMRPALTQSKPMRASRFPWMCCIWSIPARPYWKRIRARDKRTKKGGAESGEADSDASDSDHESDQDEEGEFAEEDNLDPESVEAAERAPEEEVTD
jgi:hypothetical protein